MSGKVRRLLSGKGECDVVDEWEEREIVTMTA